jgi:hypothetical protein
MEKRESEMIKNIYSYSKKHEFNNGLFYIGAGHRKSCAIETAQIF